MRLAVKWASTSSYELVRNTLCISWLIERLEREKAHMYINVRILSDALSELLNVDKGVDVFVSADEYLL